jgi:hypothetical protein
MNERTMCILIILGAIILSIILLILGCMHIDIDGNDLLNTKEVISVSSTHLLLTSCCIVLLVLCVFKYFNNRGKRHDKKI